MGQEYRDYSKSPTMSDARSAGLWHPNCGHNVNIFIPGITEERDLEWKQDFTEQYELRQQENNAKRQIKQWERRAEVAKANGDQMAYKTAKNKAKEWKEKRKDIAQKRNVLDKKQREERFSRPRGKAFPLDSSSLKSQKNENKGYSQEQAKATAEVKKKVEEAKRPRNFDRVTYNYNGEVTLGWETVFHRDKKVTGWDTGDAFNMLKQWDNAVSSGQYDRADDKAWWNEEGMSYINKVTPQSIRDAVNSDKDFRNGIYKYTTSAYKNINGVLRGQKTSQTEIKLAYETIDKLDRFFSTVGKLQEDVVLYRGMNLKGLFGDDKNATKLFKKNPEAFIGMTWTDPGYTSTSPNYTGMQGFVGSAKGDNVLLHIYADKGTKGAYIGEWSNFKEECECLLDRGMTFRIVDVQKDEDKRIHVMVEILN